MHPLSIVHCPLSTCAGKQSLTLTAALTQCLTVFISVFSRVSQCERIVPTINSYFSISWHYSLSRLWGGGCRQLGSGLVLYVFHCIIVSCLALPCCRKGAVHMHSGETVLQFHARETEREGLSLFLPPCLSSSFSRAVDCKTNGDASLAWLLLPAIKGFHLLLAAASSSSSFCCCYCCLHLVTVSFNFKRHLSLVPKTFRLTLFRQVAMSWRQHQSEPDGCLNCYCYCPGRALLHSASFLLLFFLHCDLAEIASVSPFIVRYIAINNMNLYVL